MINLTQAQAADEVKQYLGKQNYYHSVAYDTSLLISDDPGYDPFHHFHLFNRPILWINPVILDYGQGESDKAVSARAVIPCKSAEDFDGILVMNQLASLMCYATMGSHVSAISTAGTGFPSAMVVSEQFLRTSTVIQHDAIDALIRKADPDRISNKKWIALAHYRQGVIIKSPYYTFLSYWKIIELYFNNDTKAIEGHFSTTFNDHPELHRDLHEGTATPKSKLYATRNRCAHFALEQKAGDEVQNPDDPISYTVVQGDAKSLRKIVEELLNMGKW